MCADNDNVPPLKWREAYPDLVAQSAVMTAANAEERSAAARTEARAVKQAGRNATMRQRIGEDWDGRADNDNVGWPLAKALKADGKEHLLRAAMEYRRIDASANSGAQLGGTVLTTEPVQVDQRTWVRATDGALIYKGERKLTAQSFAEAPATQATRTTSETMRPAAPVPKPWTGDGKVNAMIDDKRRLERLHAALGPLVGIFEDAVLCGRTLEEVGRGRGFGSKSSASPAGKALVEAGLYAVASELARIRFDEAAPKLAA